MRTDIAIDKLCDICPIIADIADKAKEDSELRTALASGQTAGKVGVLRLIPILKTKCETEFYEILSILYGENVEDIKSKPIGDTIKRVIEITQDKEIMSFFSLFSGTAQGGALPQSASTAANE